MKLSELLYLCCHACPQSRADEHPRAAVCLTLLHSSPTPDSTDPLDYSSMEMESDCVFFYIWPHWLHCVCEISPMSCVAAICIYSEKGLFSSRLLPGYWGSSECLLLSLPSLRPIAECWCPAHFLFRVLQTEKQACRKLLE